jgi:hypothetical protein
MKSMTILAVLGAAGALGGCANLQPKEEFHYMTAVFDPAAAEQMSAPGGNTVSGSGFMKQRGGGVVTCAGSAVALTPATDYASERMEVIYGSMSGGVSLPKTAGINFVPTPLAYMKSARETRCDAQGNFSFDKVADGTFFVTTTVAWRVGYSTQGGHLMQRVTVQGGQAKSIVLAP